MGRAISFVLLLSALLPEGRGSVGAAALGSLSLAPTATPQTLLELSASSVTPEETGAAPLATPGDDSRKRKEDQAAGELLLSWLQVAGTSPYFPAAGPQTRRPVASSYQSRPRNPSHQPFPRGRRGPVRRSPQPDSVPYNLRRRPQAVGVQPGSAATRGRLQERGGLRQLGSNLRHRPLARHMPPEYSVLPDQFSAPLFTSGGNARWLGVDPQEGSDSVPASLTDPVSGPLSEEPSIAGRDQRPCQPVASPPRSYAPQPLGTSSPTFPGSSPLVSKQVGSDTPPATTHTSQTPSKGKKPPAPRPWVEPSVLSSVKRSELTLGQRDLADLVGGSPPQTTPTIQKASPPITDVSTDPPELGVSPQRVLRPRRMPETLPARILPPQHISQQVKQWRAFVQISPAISAASASSAQSPESQAMSESIDRMVPPQASYSVAAPDGTVRQFMRGAFLGAGATGIVTELIEKTSGRYFAAKFFFKEVASMEGASPAAFQAAQQRLQKESNGNELLRTTAAQVRDLWQKGFVASLGTYKLSARSGDGNQLLGTNLVDPEYTGLDGHQLMVLSDFLLLPLMGPRLDSLPHTALSDNAQKYLFHTLVTVVGSLHKSGLVHGNIRTTNVLINKLTGEAGLADFSLLMQTGSDVTDTMSFHPTQSEPERVHSLFGLGTQLPASEDFDSWNLGQLLFSLLCGFDKLPWALGQVFARFSAESPWEMAAEKFYRQFIKEVKREKFDAFCPGMTGTKLQLISIVKLLLDPTHETRWTARKLVDEHPFFQVVEDA
ncbi:rhoptry kinase family protein ROP37 (incomplete catalytic triad) [Toxoplasma gondii ARI]|uniref:non-specific serine/threonine protein kinase n=1 Tax=Toxoplasma gondii ARI TaxID=1074872 RepID=A0A139XLQ6_TOXGO|nr:rhoptry kinase family protein ROP37 (incomplete catalytic triad) [Toxoplasma gondii ARI]